MTYLNKAIFIGKVSENSFEYSTDNKGRVALTFRITVKDFSEYDDTMPHSPVSITVKCWNETADFVKKYGKPGKGLLIEGVMLNWRFGGQMQTYLRPTRITLLEGNERDKKTNKKWSHKAPINDGLFF